MSGIDPADVLDVQRIASDPVGVGLGRGQCRLGQDACAGAARDPPAAARHAAGEDPLPHLHQGRRRQHGEPRVRDARASGRALDDAALDAEIEKIEGRRPDAARRVHARRLFAQALDTPGGLKVQTIHAFCTRLLHQFPFEADVAARFEVLEERTRSELIDRLRMGVLLEAAAQAGQRRSAARSRPRSRSRPTGPSPR